ncbi:MAG: RNA 2',3'-cyclic phosphodiesterase [Deltaproteobacteria bacterium]|nr:RNA 2',3'-cyclic phosphodiesterase [Deltaproteobacteria bacterium]
MESIRTFIALELPAGLKAVLARMQKTFMQRSAGVKWVRPESIHLTLKFLGATSMEQVDRVCGVLDHLTRNVEPFPFDVTGLGAFPNSRNPKVIWAGMQVEGRLKAFHQELETALAAVGFAAEDRAFAPHLTLGRLRDGLARKDVAGLIEQFSSEQFGRFEGDHIIFFKSELKPSGPVYMALKDITLLKNA